jgi:hypothetical protein
MSYVSKFEDNYLTSAIYNSLGSAYALVNNLDSALFFYKKAYTVAEQSNNKVALVGILNTLTEVYYLKGDL